LNSTPIVTLESVNFARIIKLSDFRELICQNLD
jgi:hypothetical protein